MLPCHHCQIFVLRHIILCTYKYRSIAFFTRYYHRDRDLQRCNFVRLQSHRCFKQEDLKRPWGVDAFVVTVRRATCDILNISLYSSCRPSMLYSIPNVQHQPNSITQLNNNLSTHRHYHFIVKLQSRFLMQSKESAGSSS